jgi:hypothetical protein
LYELPIAGNKLAEIYVRFGVVAQLGERRLCKPDVTGSNPVSSTTTIFSLLFTTVFTNTPSPEDVVDKSEGIE